MFFLETAGEFVPTLPLSTLLDMPPVTFEDNFLVALAVVGFIKLKFELGVARLPFIGLPGERTDDVPPEVDEEARRIGLDLATEVVVIVVMLGDDIVVRKDPFLDISVRLVKKCRHKYNFSY